MYFRAYFILLKGFVAGLILCGWQISSAFAFDLGLGIAAVEQGDDSQRPAVVINAGTNFYAVRAYAYGRDYGPVSERTYSLSLLRRFGILASKDIEATLGMVIMNEQISLNYTSDQEAVAEAAQKKAISSTENNYNIGAAMGIYYRILRTPLDVSLGWEAHLFPAGVQGGILLSTGRKQYLSLSSGYTW